MHMHVYIHIYITSHCYSVRIASIRRTAAYSTRTYIHACIHTLTNGLDVAKVKSSVFNNNNVYLVV